MPPGRPPTTQPATAFDYRRHIVLVQAIATGKWTALNALMTAWNVPIERAWCNMDGRPTFEGMCHMLARFVVQYHSEDAAGDAGPGATATLIEGIDTKGDV